MTKKPASKSITANFGALSSAPPDPVPVPVPAPADAALQPGPAAASPQRPLARVGAGIIGATQRSLAEIREERDRLQSLVAKGAGLELDPGIIDPSPFPDRLPDDSDADFEAFKKTLAEEGQKVPIQVRIHPDAPERYQVVYGHRRWRAAKELGLKVKAILMDLTDSELVVAQGIENAVRQDLSWIERALFVWRMDQAGVKPRDIKAALSVDDPELARLRAVTRSVPIEVIESIGRAPKAGRPRWTALAGAINADPAALGRVRKALSSDKATGSDDRFRKALGAAVMSRPEGPTELDLQDGAGKVVGKAVFEKSGVRLRLDKGDGAAFADFLREQLPELMEKFAARTGSE